MYIIYLHIFLHILFILYICVYISRYIYDLYYFSFYIIHIIYTYAVFHDVKFDVFWELKIKKIDENVRTQ